MKSNSATSKQYSQLLSAGDSGFVRLWLHSTTMVLTENISKKKKDSKMKSTSKILWEMKIGNDTINDARTVPSSYGKNNSNNGLIILGSNNAGTITILDIYRRTKKAFATSGSRTPTIVRQFHLPGLLQRAFPSSRATSDAGNNWDRGTPPSQWLGVQNLTVWSNSNISKHPHRHFNNGDDNKNKNEKMSYQDVMASVMISVVAKCGWVINLSFLSSFETVRNHHQINSTQQQTNIIPKLSGVHMTERACILSSGEQKSRHRDDFTVAISKPPFSLPDVPCAGATDEISSLIYVSDVPPNLIWPKLDKTIADSSNNIATTDAAFDPTKACCNSLRILDLNGISSSDKLFLPSPPLTTAISQFLSEGTDSTSHNEIYDDGIERTISTIGRIKIRSTPACIVSHPNADWAVIGYGDGGRMELICL